MIYSRPTRAPRELELQLRALKECAQFEPVLREDLRRLKRSNRIAAGWRRCSPMAGPVTRKESNAGRRPALITA